MLSEPADEPELDDELALDVAASCETDALRLVSQTSCGITIASSRRTRSQSNRLWARLATVCSLDSCRAAKSANDFVRSASACAVDSCDSRLDFSALRSEIWLLMRTIPVIVSKANPSTATTT